MGRGETLEGLLGLRREGEREEDKKFGFYSFRKDLKKRTRKMKRRTGKRRRRRGKVGEAKE